MSSELFGASADQSSQSKSPPSAPAVSDATRAITAAQAACETLTELRSCTGQPPACSHRVSLTRIKSSLANPGISSLHLSALRYGNAPGPHAPGALIWDIARQQGAPSEFWDTFRKRWEALTESYTATRRHAAEVEACFDGTPRPIEVALASSTGSTA